MNQKILNIDSIFLFMENKNIGISLYFSISVKITIKQVLLYFWKIKRQEPLILR
jgi:hypothetical protein